jgi:hypothetical protein
MGGRRVGTAREARERRRAERAAKRSLRDATWGLREAERKAQLEAKRQAESAQRKAKWAAGAAKDNATVAKKAAKRAEQEAKWEERAPIALVAGLVILALIFIFGRGVKEWAEGLGWVAWVTVVPIVVGFVAFWLWFFGGGEE